MYYFIYVLRFVFPVAVNSDALMLDNLQDLQEQDFEQFEEVMGVKRKNYVKAINAIKNAREIRDTHGYKTKIYASAIQYDGEQQERMEQFANQHIKPFVDEYYLLPLYSMGAVATQREAELGYRPTAGNQGRIGGLVAPLPCWSVISEGHVRADSTFSLCCFDGDGRFTVGDLKKDSFMDVWHNEDFQKVRAAHLKGDLTGTVCEECVAY